MSKTIYFILSFLLLTSMASATTFGYNYLDNKIYGNKTTINNYSYYNYSTNNTFDSDQFDVSGDEVSISSSWLTGFLDIWLGTKDTDDLAQGSTNLYDNQSWNEEYANTLYADINSTESNIYIIDFTSSKNSIISYNLTEADASVITVNTTSGKKEIYGADFE